MKKGMEENGQRTDPGTDGRQEQEDAVLRGQLQQALDSVEPDGEARERMLRRIREKAADRSDLAEIFWVDPLIIAVAYLFHIPFLDQLLNLSIKYILFF